MVDNNLDSIRHTLAHLLAQAVLEKYPHAKSTIGPAVDDGFYYDFDFSGGEAPGDADLANLQKAMRKNLNKWADWEHEVVTADEARTKFEGNEYKIELIDELEEKGEEITLYTSGGFTDLCRGGHADNPAEDIDAKAFKLDKIAGAYWRGDEKNQMLTRIYGLAFETEDALKEHLVMLEEAKKRDHRKIGKEQNLFVFSSLVGSGMPLYTPKGNFIRNQIIGYSRILNERLGFGEVHTPNINKGELFKVSGHYDQYKEDMLTVRSQYVNDEMFLKPMNCPQHTQIYASQPRSYRDLPIRFSDFANLYRDERPGELSGLTRLRSFAQDDGHSFCREDQIESEVSDILEAIQEALAVYKIDFWMRLSLRDPENKNEYLGDDAVWERSENILRELLKEKKIEFKEEEGEAAFYGPKIDIVAVDAIGREWQISTVQLDFSMPARFELTYTDKDGSDKTPVMIHRALIGSPDRFLAILLEHYGGALPSWLAPEQVRIIPVADAHDEYAQKVHDELKSAGLRIQIAHAEDSLGKRIRGAKIDKVPYHLVLGDDEAKGDSVMVESRDDGKIGAMTVEEFIEKIKGESVV